MFISLLIFLLVSNAVTLTRDKSILFSRLCLIILSQITTFTTNIYTSLQGSFLHTLLSALFISVQLFTTYLVLQSTYLDTIYMITSYFINLLFTVFDYDVLTCVCLVLALWSFSGLVYLVLFGNSVKANYPKTYIYLLITLSTVFAVSSIILYISILLKLYSLFKAIVKMYTLKTEPFNTGSNGPGTNNPSSSNQGGNPNNNRPNSPIGTHIDVEEIKRHFKNRVKYYNSLSTQEKDRYDQGCVGGSFSAEWEAAQTTISQKEFLDKNIDKLRTAGMDSSLLNKLKRTIKASMKITADSSFNQTAYAQDIIEINRRLNIIKGNNKK